MTLNDEQRNQTLELLTFVGAIETSLLRARSQLADIRYRLNVMLWPVKDLDDIDRGHGSPTCRHETPIGDYCPYCTETPEG
jgi:hypothetical protein